MARTLYLIDGHAQIFRAYFAIPAGMSSPVTGEPTHAIFAFAGLLLKFFQQFQPQYAAMIIDLPGKTFRDELYPAYKATREPLPPDFLSQEKRIFEIVRLAGIPILSHQGAEADDVIATLARRTVASPATADVLVRIISGDKDLQQLLGDRVTMLDIHKDAVIDVAALRRDKGVTPEQVVDLLALMGDKVDNIPGVPGVGPKTAAELIQQFGSIEGIYAHLDQIKGKRRENLEAARDKLPLSRQLVTLKDDLPVPTDLETLRLGRPDVAALKRLFGDLGFRRHVAELDKLFGSAPAPATGDQPAAGARASDGELFPDLFGAPAPTVAATADDVDLPPPPGVTTAAVFDYRAVTTKPQLRELVATIGNQPLVSLDTETIGFGRTATLCGISLAWEPGHAVYIPVRSPTPAEHLDPETVLAALRPWLVDPQRAKCGHNLKFDLLVLRAAGIEMQGVVFDSMIASFLLGLPAHGLDVLSRELLQHQSTPISRLIGPKPARRGEPSAQRTMAEVPLDQIVPYAAEDADLALRLQQLFAPRLAADGLDQLARDIEMPLVAVLAEMEWNGIGVDPAVLEAQKRVLAARIAVLRTQIWEAAGTEFNLDSPKQLAEILFQRLKLPVIRRGKTGPSTDAEVLDTLADPNQLPASVPAQHAAVPRLIVEYRQLTKLVNTYLDSLREAIDPHTKRVHATFHQTGAATGRLSSSDPNLQNIPIRTEEGRQVRRAFVAAPGQVFVSADYSQIELRVLAHLSEDPGLIAAFERDDDIHRAVAAQVFGVAAAAVTPAQRGHAKVINFGIIYGVTPWGLARRIDGLDVEGATRLIDSYKQRYAGIDRFLARCVQQALDQGYVTTMFGRRRLIPQIQSQTPATRSFGERLAINSVVQGSAADLIKLAMVNLQRRTQREELPLRLLLQIHDELVVETPEPKAPAMAAVLQEEMERAVQLRVPLKVDTHTGRDWYEAK